MKESDSETIRAVIADDHALFLDGLRMLLNTALQFVYD